MSETPDLPQRLEARATLYSKVMEQCRAELAEADTENAQQGAETHFALDPCPTCDDSAELIPLLREAAAEIERLRAR